MIFSRACSPRTIDTWEGATPSAPASNRQTARLARPSSAGALTRTTSTPSLHRDQLVAPGPGLDADGKRCVVCHAVILDTSSLEPPPSPPITRCMSSSFRRAVRNEYLWVAAAFVASIFLAYTVLQGVL